MNEVHHLLTWIWLTKLTKWKAEPLKRERANEAFDKANPPYKRSKHENVQS